MTSVLYALVASEPPCVVSWHPPPPETAKCNTTQHNEEVPALTAMYIGSCIHSFANQCHGAIKKWAHAVGFMLSGGCEVCQVMSKASACLRTEPARRKYTCVAVCHHQHQQPTVLPLYSLFLSLCDMRCVDLFVQNTFYGRKGSRLHSSSIGQPGVLLKGTARESTGATGWAEAYKEGVLSWTAKTKRVESCSLSLFLALSRVWSLAGRRSKMEAAASKLMDFSQPMDVALLDQVVTTAFDASHPQVRDMAWSSIECG